MLVEAAAAVLVVVVVDVQAVLCSLVWLELDRDMCELTRECIAWVRPEDLA